MGERPYVVVHQMGRVGSTALWRALQAHPELDAERVGSSHRVSDDAYRWRVWTLDREGRRPGNETAWTRRIREWIAAPPARIDFVTPVRDPVARNVSKYFFERGRGLIAADPSIVNMDVTRAIEHFYATTDHREPLRWFGSEVHDPLGIDVFTGSFAIERGWDVFEHGRFRMLVLRADLSDAEKARVTAEYLGVKPFEIERMNAVSPAGDASLYEQFRAEATLEPAYLDWMYDSAYARRFFTPAELATWREQWSTPQREPVHAT